MTAAAKHRFSLAATGVATAWPAGAEFHDHMGMWSGSWGWGHMAAGSLLMLLFWGGLIAFLVILVRWITGAGLENARPASPRASALDLLEERYARGEIDRTEFEERREVLASRRAGGRGRAR